MFELTALRANPEDTFEVVLNDLQGNKLADGSVIAVIRSPISKEYREFKNSVANTINEKIFSENRNLKKTLEERDKERLDELLAVTVAIKGVKEDMKAILSDVGYSFIHDQILEAFEKKGLSTKK